MIYSPCCTESYWSVTISCWSVNGNILTTNVVHRTIFTSSTRNVYMAVVIVLLHTFFYFIFTKISQADKKPHIYSLSHNCSAILAVRKRSTQFNANRLSRLLIQSSVEYLIIIQTSYVTWPQFSAYLYNTWLRGDVSVQMWFVWTVFSFECRECRLFIVRWQKQSDDESQSIIDWWWSKLRLRHSVTSLVDILRVIQRVHERHDERENIINRADVN